MCRIVCLRRVLSATQWPKVKRLTLPKKGLPMQKEFRAIEREIGQIREVEYSLKPTFFIDSDETSIIQTVKGLMTSSKVESVKRIFEFVRDEIPYNFAPIVDSKNALKASHTLRIGNGFCIQKAVLFTALCRSGGIPAKIGFQKIRSHKIVGPYLELLGSNEFEYHGLNAVYINGKWVKLDCTLDRALVTRKGYILIEFDPGKDALFPKYDLAGLPHFDILKEHGFFFDVPEEICNHFLRSFQEMDKDAWRELVHKTDACY